MIRDIKIHPVLNGFVVTVGCQALAFESGTKLLEELHRYLTDSDNVERIYREKALNRWILESAPVEACPPPTRNIVSQNDCGRPLTEASSR